MARKPHPIPPTDRGEEVARRHKQGKVPANQLYEQLERAGLSAEEAAEMADLLEQGGM